MKRKFLSFVLVLVFILSAAFSLYAFQMSSEKPYVFGGDEPQPAATEIQKIGIKGIVPTPSETVKEADVSTMAVHLLTLITPISITRYSFEKDGKLRNYDVKSIGLAYGYMLGNMDLKGENEDVTPVLFIGPFVSGGLIEKPANSKEYGMTYSAGISLAVKIGGVPLAMEYGYDFTDYKFLLAFGAKFDFAEISDIFTIKLGKNKK